MNNIKMEVDLSSYKTMNLTFITNGQPFELKDVPFKDLFIEKNHNVNTTKKGLVIKIESLNSFLLGLLYKISSLKYLSSLTWDPDFFTNGMNLEKFQKSLQNMKNLESLSARGNKYPVNEIFSDLEGLKNVKLTRMKLDKNISNRTKFQRSFIQNLRFEYISFLDDYVFDFRLDDLESLVFSFCNIRSFEKIHKGFKESKKLKKLKFFNNWCVNGDFDGKEGVFLFKLLKEAKIEKFKFQHKNIFKIPFEETLPHIKKLSNINYPLYKEKTAKFIIHQLSPNLEKLGIEDIHEYSDELIQLAKGFQYLKKMKISGSCYEFILDVIKVIPIQSISLQIPNTLYVDSSKLNFQENFMKELHYNRNIKNIKIYKFEPNDLQIYELFLFNYTILRFNTSKIDLDEKVKGYLKRNLDLSKIYHSIILRGKDIHFNFS